jgi:hypothetical protein
MSKDLTATVGFTCRPGHAPARRLARLELVASVALVVSTVIAATMVSIGIARAATPSGTDDAYPFAVALCLGLLLAAAGGLTTVIARGRLPRA